MSRVKTVAKQILVNNVGTYLTDQLVTIPGLPDNDEYLLSISFHSFLSGGGSIVFVVSSDVSTDYYVCGGYQNLPMVGNILIPVKNKRFWYRFNRGAGEIVSLLSGALIILNYVLKVNP